MDVETKALLHFVIIISTWILLPLVPAWLTYRITPNQTLGLKGPLHAMTLNSTGSFAAYVIVALLLSSFTWPIGKILVGRITGDNTWHITGHVELFGPDGKRIEMVPDLSKAQINVLPNPNVISSDLSLRVPFVQNEKPTIYIDVPKWGGTVISFRDPDSFIEDPLTRTIKLRNNIQIRQPPEGRKVIGEEP